MRLPRSLSAYGHKREHLLPQPFAPGHYLVRLPRPYSAFDHLVTMRCVCSVLSALKHRLWHQYSHQLHHAQYVASTRLLYGFGCRLGHLPLTPIAHSHYLACLSRSLFALATEYYMLSSRSLQIVTISCVCLILLCFQTLSVPSVTSALDHVTI